MWYSIYCEDKKNSLDLRMKTRESHLEQLKLLLDQGRILIAGPCPAIDNEDPGEHGFTGSLIVADFPSIQEAREWAKNDPYYIAGVFESVTVKPFKKVFP